MCHHQLTTTTPPSSSSLSTQSFDFCCTNMVVIRDTSSDHISIDRSLSDYHHRETLFIRKKLRPGRAIHVMYVYLFACFSTRYYILNCKRMCGCVSSKIIKLIHDNVLLLLFFDDYPQKPNRFSRLKCMYIFSKKYSEMIWLSAKCTDDFYRFNMPSLYICSL